MNKIEAREILKKLNINVNLKGCYKEILPRLKEKIDDGEITLDELSKHFDEETALNWALYIGDKDIMREKIKTEKYALNWVLFIGDRELMIKKIKTERGAFDWALCLENRDIMIKKNKDGAGRVEVGSQHWR